MYLRLRQAIRQAASRDGSAVQAADGAAPDTPESLAWQVSSHLFTERWWLMKARQG